MKRLLRKILGVTRNGRRRNVDVRGAELKIIDNDVADTVQRRRLAYFRCVVCIQRTLSGECVIMDILQEQEQDEDHDGRRLVIFVMVVLISF